MERRYKDKIVGICLAVYDQVVPIVYSNHISLVAKWNRELCEMITFVVGDTSFADAMGGMVEAGLERKCTHMLFLHDKITMEESLLSLLLEADKDIISGLACANATPFEQTCQMYLKDSDFQYVTAALPLDNKVHTVDFCCFECVLIKMDVFSHMERPYFLDTAHELGHMRIPYNKKCKRAFQERAREKGYLMNVHAGAPLGRVGREFMVSPDSESPNGAGKIVLV